MVERRITREVPVGNLVIGGEHPIVVQSMTATKTQDVEATTALVNELQAAGAGIIRLAVDSPKDAEALAWIRSGTDANLSIDLQENYRLITKVAPFVQKVRYNPGHLWHHEKEKSIKEKVAFLAKTAEEHGIPLRVGVNHGSIDPRITEKYPEDDTISPMIDSAVQHCEILEDLGFPNYVVSLKDSNPQRTVTVNRIFAELMPDVPLHLGVTESGLPQYGIRKSYYALGQLLTEGIGETLRVSLTVPNDEKTQEVFVGQRIIDDVVSERYVPGAPIFEEGRKLDIISCPSCSRVENERFVKLAQEFDDMTQDIKEHPLTVSFMGCRVNGPGEGDFADLGAWCGPTRVNLKRKSDLLGSFSYDEILCRMRQEIEQILVEREAMKG